MNAMTSPLVSLTPAMRPRCLAVLGDISLPAQAQDRGLMDRLIGWSERS